ncbi:MAG: PASTA domain-containing protein [Schleiferiaceae bacterium]|nr:PASTA domain-containing protein [Schleiferiaceae bacterium]
MKFIAFLKSKTLLANVVLAALFIVIVWFGIIWGLGLYTRQGKQIQVPDLMSFSVSEVSETLDRLDLRWTVLDSSDFTTEVAPGAIVGQYPEAGQYVKKNRELKLTVNPMGPRQIEIPTLEEKTRRRAIYDLESKGFVVGRLRYVPYLGKDVVVSAEVNGIEVFAGERYPKGTKVDLVLGDGLSDVRVGVPYLMGATLDDATAKLKSAGLNIGAIIFDEDLPESLKGNALVYRQNPQPTYDLNTRQGTPIDIWLTSNREALPSDSLDFIMRNPNIYEIPDSLRLLLDTIVETEDSDDAL